MLSWIKKHWDVAKASYELEKENAPTNQVKQQHDFLPAALALVEQPPSPVGRKLAWLLILLFTIAIAWSYFGKIDVVSVAQGKVVTRGQTKIVQSFEPGVVLAIHVENGQSVKQGQVLVELDATESTADVTRLRQQHQSAEVNKTRNEWLYENLEKNDALTNDPEYPPHIEAGIARVQTLLARSQLQEYVAVQEAYHQQLQEKRVELEVAKKRLDKLNETLPLLEEQVKGMAQLAGEGITARFKYLEYEERYIERKKDLVIEQDRILQVKAGISSVEKQKEKHRQEFKKQIVSDLAEATNNLVAYEQELKKAERTFGFQRIRAPVDGVVQQLTVYTIGGVVKPGDALMAVVPATRELEVEVSILNKDIGFVSEGQDAEIKLEAFPFTKYGVIDGIIQSIDLDAVQNEDLGLVYPARITIEKSEMTIGDKQIPLNPGMALTAEIKTGKRRLIEFLLSPLLRYKDESLRER